MHYLLELYSPKPAWLALDGAARQAYFDTVGAGMAALSGTAPKRSPWAPSMAASCMPLPSNSMPSGASRTRRRWTPCWPASPPRAGMIISTPSMRLARPWIFLAHLAQLAA